jgi:hypothetical protein
MRRFASTTLVIASICAAPAAWGQGQVNGSGATLFVDFFTFPAATNDFIDCDGDGVAGPLGPPNFADPLSNTNPDNFGNFGPDAPGGENWFLLQYRSVGSVRGYNEFVSYQLCEALPEDVPSERGTINSLDFAVTGVPVWVGPPSSCTDDLDGDPNNGGNMSGTPVCPETMDFSNTDVPSAWATQGASGTPAWNATPTSGGYGRNENLSNGDADDAGKDNLLASIERDCDGSGTIDPGESLNFNTNSPDDKTIYDTTIAFSPVSPIANRGLDISVITYTQAQHAWVTGRMPNGLNPAVATRDVGSGTRNGWANPLGIDPSWCVGDHRGIRRNTTPFTILGPDHQVANCGGSSVLEAAVQNRRIALGYTGLFGGSRSIADALANKYEMLGIIKDIDSDSDGNPDADTPVRPGLTNVLFNDNPNTGYQIGGLQTFSTVGDPDANRDANDPLFDGLATPMARDVAACFINNITSSIALFEEPNDPNLIEPQTAMPGEILATEFALEAAVSATPILTNPSRYQPNPRFNPALQTFIAANSSVPATPGYGTVGNGRVPNRTSLDGVDPNSAVTVYSDGSVDGAYFNYFTDDPNAPSIVGDSAVNARNKIAGDFDGDGDRDCDDIAGLMAAIDDPSGYATTAPGSTSGNPLVPEIIGDFTGDGDLDLDDARYFADGLAMDPNSGNLDREKGFELVDLGNQTATGTLNTFGTGLVTGKAYEAGDSRGDVAGNSFVTPGAEPTGADSLVDATDINYVCANFGDWTDLDDALAMDLSCDMNGDLSVDTADIAAIVEDILGTHLGDANLDGAVNITDLGIVLQSFGTSAGWSGGDFNCDGQVNITDLGIVLQNFGS